MAIRKPIKKTLYLDDGWFLSNLRTGNRTEYTVAVGLPVDAEMVSASYDTVKGRIVLVVQSSLFEDDKKELKIELGA